MALMENDFDSFGVLFEVRTSGLDSVKGVVNGLISTDKWAKEAQGSLIRVNDAVEVLKKTGMSSRESLDFVSKGGNDLLKFSHQAQRAAMDVARFADEFHNLETKRRQLMSTAADVENNHQLNMVRQQMATITNRLASQRERVLQQEAVGGGVSGFSATQRTMSELGATKPLINFQSAADDASRKLGLSTEEFTKQLTGSQRVLYEVAQGLKEALVNTKQRLSAGGKPWYGETDGTGRSIGEMRTGGILDMQGRPQPGSRARGAESTGEHRDPVLTEKAARDLENQAIALEAAHSRMVKAYSGSAAQSEVVLRDWTRSMERTKSEMVAAAIHYRENVLPERAMQRATSEVDRLIRQQTGVHNVENILYPGAIAKGDERINKIRSEALDIINKKAENPTDTPEMTRVRERYAALISRARSNITDDVRQKASAGDYESYVAIKDAEQRALRLGQRRDHEFERARLGPTEFASRQLEQSTSAAESLIQIEKVKAAYKQLFGSKRIDDLVKEIESLDIPLRDKRRKVNELESKYATFLREGDMPENAAEVERRVRERQRQARLERAQERSQKYDEESRQRLSILNGGATGPAENPLTSAYQKAVEEARRNLRSTFPIKGGSTDGLGPNSFTPRDSRAYDRMMEAERTLEILGRQRARNFEDLDIRARKLGDTQFAYATRIADAEKRTQQRRTAAQDVEIDAAGRIAAKQASYEEQRRIAAFKFAQDQERTQLRIDQLYSKRDSLVSKTFNDVPNEKGRRDRLIEERDSQVAQLERGIRLLQEIKGAPGATGLRERQYNYAENTAAFELEQFKQTQAGKVSAARASAEQAAAQENQIRAQSSGRLATLNEEFRLRQKRIFEDTDLKRDEAERKIARARVRYTEDSLREIDRIFSRKGETLQETMMRTRRPAEFQGARQDQLELMDDATMSPLRRLGLTADTAETTSRSYAKLRDQIAQINAEVDKRREKVETAKSEGLDRLGIMQMHATSVAPEFRPQAEENLSALRTRTTERVTKLQNEYFVAEDAALNKSTKAHAQYLANLTREQKNASRAIADANAQSMFNLMLQFGGAVAAVKSFVVETVQYAARTETMKIVTEQMARTNDINTTAIFHQISAIKSLNITTQEAHGVVQRMIFAQLDVAKATSLARVAQNAATVSGENSSETLNKIITGIVTGQTRLLHYMGLQVSMQQTLRQLRAELGREPTEIEKRTAMLNAVLSEGTKISGNYEAAMLTAGKQVLSLKRQFQEAQNAIGQEFQPTYTRIIGSMSSFAASARQNSSEIALFTRAVAGLTAAFLALQTVNFLRASGGGFLSTLGEGLGLLGKDGGAGTIKTARDAAGAAGAGTLGRAAAGLRAAPILPWAALLTSLGIGAAVAYNSGASPMEGVKSTISSTKSQQELDRRQMELAYRTGDIDLQSYQEAMGRFYEQDRSLRRKSIVAVSQVWIDQARKAAEVAQEQQRTTRELTQGGGIGNSLKLMGTVGLPTLFNAVTWPVIDNKYKSSGFTLGEYLGGRRLGGAKTSEEEFKNILLRLRKKIEEEGDVITEQGVVSVKEKLRAFDEWSKALDQDRNRKNDPLYNVRLSLQQETDNLEDIVGKKVQNAKEKIRAIADRVIDRAITDPVEKVRQKMESELFEQDITNTPEFQSSRRLLKSLDQLRQGRGQSGRYDEYKQLSDQLDKLGINQDQLQVYQKAMSGQDESNPNIIHYGENGIMLRSSRLAQFGLTDFAPKFDEYERITRRMKDMREGAAAQFDPKTGAVTREAAPGDPELELRLRLEKSIEKNREDQKRLRDAFQIEINQELLARRQRYETKLADSQISQAQTFAGPGVEAERQTIQSTYESRRQLEAKQHQDRVNFVNSEFTAEKMRRDGQTIADAQKEASLLRQNLLASEQETTNEKLRELDQQRILSLLQINQQQRQIQLSIDIERVQGNMRAQEAVLGAQIRGDDRRLELAQKIHDLEIETAYKIYAKDNNQGDFIKRSDTAGLELFLKQVDFAKDKVDKTKTAAEEMIRAQFDRSEKLLRAQALGPLDEIVANRRNFELKKRQIEQLHDLDMKVADSKKQREEADDKRRKQTADAELEFLTQRMELFKKQREEGMKMAGDVFDAMERQAHGQGGFKDLFSGIFKTTQKQVFENLFGDLFTEMGRKLVMKGQGTAEKPTFLGDLLKGTIFGIKDDPRKDIAKYNDALLLRQDGVIKSNETVSSSSRNLSDAMNRLATAMDALRALKAPELQGALYSPVSGKYPEFTPVSSLDQVKAIVDQGQEGTTPAPRTLTPSDPEYWGLPADSPVRPPEAMKAASEANWAQNTVLPQGGGRTSAQLRSYFGVMPDAYSKIGRRPIYTYSDAADSSAGEHDWGEKGVRLNTARMPNGTEGQILQHELTHDLMEPGIPAMSADPELQKYFDKIRGGLISNYGDMYKGNDGQPLRSENVVTEALAYNAQKGSVPGLSNKESQSFVDRAMVVASESKHGELVDLYKKLQSPEAGQFTMKAAAPGQIDAVQAKIRAAAEEEGVDPSQVLGLAKSESGFDQAKTSRTGARGVFQFTRGTAKEMGIDREDLDQNIGGGVKYWKKLLEKNGGDVDKAIAAYKGVSVGGATMADVAKARQMMGQFAESGSEVEDESPKGPRRAFEAPQPYESSQAPAPVDLPSAPVPNPLGAMAPLSIPASNSMGIAQGATHIFPWVAGAAPAGGQTSADVSSIGGASTSVIEDILKSRGKADSAKDIADASTSVNRSMAVARSGGNDSIPSLTSQAYGTYSGLYGAIHNLRAKNALSGYNKLSEEVGVEAPSEEQLKKLNSYRHRMGLSPLATPSSSSEIGAEGVVEGTGLPTGTVEGPEEGSGEGRKGGNVSSKIGTGMQIAGGAALAYDAFKSFKRGGAQGAVSGAQDILGIASMIPGPQQPFVMAGAMALGFVKSLMGDPRAKYKKMLEDELKKSKFSEADSQERTMNTSGQFIDFDFLGRPREGARPITGPTGSLTDVQYNQMLQTNRGLSGSSATPGALNQLAINVNVSTMDSRSFMDNGGKIADSLRQQLIINHPIGNEIRQIAGA